jgi:phosphohistidine phosphatase
MNLILWRHAEAEEGSNDLARALTSKGHRQAKRMATWLEARLPDKYKVICSRARRSQVRLVHVAEGCIAALA